MKLVRIALLAALAVSGTSLAHTPVLQGLARELIVLQSGVSKSRKVFAGRTDLNDAAKARIKSLLDLINESIGRLKAIEPTVLSVERETLTTAITEDTVFLEGLGTAPEPEIEQLLAALSDDLAAKAADRKGSGAYGNKSRSVTAEVHVVAVVNNQRIEKQGFRISAVKLARSKFGCLDKPFGQLSGPASEPFFSGAYRFCAFQGERLVGSVQWIAIGLDGKALKRVEILVP